jgi:anthranilate/para-aminobenzoate synthase component I
MKPNALSLCELDQLNSFALLSPHFSSRQTGWTLFTNLTEKHDSNGFFFAPYESKAPQFFSGTRETIEIQFDGITSVSAPTIHDAAFASQVEQIRQLIAQGDVYQVNLTLRAHFDSPVTARALFQILCQKSVPRFAAWVRLPNGTEFVSGSPEMLFDKMGNTIRVEPMKGTARPGELNQLLASEKDKSELAMIVDLLRDDLHRLCIPKSVRVTNQRRAIELPYAIQTVADIEGTLFDSANIKEIIGALHPGGSVTGTPRKAACETIAQMESTPRGAYCGVLGLYENERAVASLLIRTAEKRESGFVYGVGGGITWDSQAALEREEIETKLGIFK